MTRRLRGYQRSEPTQAARKVVYRGANHIIMFLLDFKHSASLPRYATHDQETKNLGVGVAEYYASTAVPQKILVVVYMNVM